MATSNEPDSASRAAGRSAPAFWRWPLHWQILLGLLIGAWIGYLIGHDAVASLSADVAPENAGRMAADRATSTWAYLAFDLVGDLFLQGLKLIIVPLITSSILLAIVNIGARGGFGRLGLKTLGYYLTTSLIAIVIGLTLINLVAPGTTDAAPPVGGGAVAEAEASHQTRGILEGRDLSAFAEDQAQVQQKAGGKTGRDFLDVFRQMVPPNVVAAAAKGQLLGLIVVSLLVGYFLARSEGKPREVIEAFVQGVYDITLRITDIVLRLAPVGVLGLLAASFAEQYAKLAPDARFEEFLAGISLFALTAFAALAAHLLIVMPLILALVARVNPLRHYRAMAPALVTAFSTASSSATLPLTMECGEDRAGVSNKTTSFVLPLGATINMDGTALYECVAAIFICQAFGLELTFAQQFMIVLTALFTSVGVAGVPAASLVAIVVILQAVQAQLPPGTLPEGAMLVTGLGLLMVFDRPLDMCRTAVNVFSDSVGAVTIARSEGETNILTRPATSAAQPQTSQ